jgi:hypothetical protein
MSTISMPRRRAALAAFRAALFASAAVTALSLTCAAPVRADCTGTTEVVCTGDLHNGVHYRGPEKLIVRDPSTNITPPNGQAGISLQNSGPVSPTAAIDADVFPYSISTQDNDAPGIFASAPGDVTIHSIGDIVTWGGRGDAILAVSRMGKATVKNEATLSTHSANSDGIAAIGPLKRP